jgi:hypothetical protein
MDSKTLFISFLEILQWRRQHQSIEPLQDKNEDLPVTTTLQGQPK